MSFGFGVRVDALIVTMTAPVSVGRVRPAGEARTPRIGRRLPAGGARRVAVLAGDVRGRDEPGDDRRDRRRRLTELLLPALRRRRPRRHDMIRGRLDLLVGGVVRQARHPCEQDRESLLVQLLAAAEVLGRRRADPADGAVARERAGRVRRPVSGRGGADELQFHRNCAMRSAWRNCPRRSVPSPAGRGRGPRPGGSRR